MAVKQRRGYSLLLKQEGIRKMILDQLDAFELKNADVVREFAEAGITLHGSSLSRYLNFGGERSDVLSEQQLILLCFLLNIKVGFIAQKIVKLQTKKQRVKRLKDKWAQIASGQRMISLKEVITLKPEKK